MTVQVGELISEVTVEGETPDSVPQPPEWVSLAEFECRARRSLLDAERTRAQGNDD